MEKYIYVHGLEDGILLRVDFPKNQSINSTRSNQIHIPKRLLGGRSWLVDSNVYGNAKYLD